MILSRLDRTLRIPLRNDRCFFIGVTQVTLTVVDVPVFFHPKEAVHMGDYHEIPRDYYRARHVKIQRHTSYRHHESWYGLNRYDGWVEKGARAAAESQHAEPERYGQAGNFR